MNSAQIKNDFIIIGNWKMNKSIHDSVVFIEKLRRKLCSYIKLIKKKIQIKIILFPSYVAINSVINIVKKDEYIKIGAQDLFWEDYGSFTGAISASMIKELGAEYVIIGHSERRFYFNETDEIVNKKIQLALKYSLIPIVCIGNEISKDLSFKEIYTLFNKQIFNIFVNIEKNSIKKVIFAYEPFYAIGNNIPINIIHIEKVHNIIRMILKKNFYVSNSKILYGGNVNLNNIKKLLFKRNINGVLIGKSSLDLNNFFDIIKNINLKILKRTNI